MPHDLRHRITVYAMTDVGMVRAGNEDTFLVVNLDTSDTWTPVTVEDEPPAHLSSFEQSSHGTVLAVSDGMGGALAGEVASRMAVDGVRHHMLHFQSSGTFASFPFHEQLRLAVEQANSQINNESMSNADYAGMGATFTAAGVDNGVLTIAQIGDSRCYLIRNGRIALVTHDQSLVWQLVEAGHITEEEAETHQYKNVILQALGAQPRINVVVDRIPLNHGDTVLLCSDGLSGRVRAEEMLDIVTKGSTLREACEALIQLANDRGGEDNITVVLAQFDGEDLPPPGEMLSERIERDPNLPYEIDLLADSEPTLSPDVRPADAAQVLASGDAPSGFSAKVTALFGKATAPMNVEQTAPLDPSPVTAPAGAKPNITPELADQIAKLNEETDQTVPTAVGIPALTPELIAAHAEMLASKSGKDGNAPAEAPVNPTAPAPVVEGSDDAEGGILGPVITMIAILALLGLGTWLLHRQQVNAEAARANMLDSASRVQVRMREARAKLQTVTPAIDGLSPGAPRDEAVELRDRVSAGLERITPLVDPSKALPGTISEAETIIRTIDADLTRIGSILSESQTAAAPASPLPGATPGETAPQPAAPVSSSTASTNSAPTNR